MQCMPKDLFSLTSYQYELPQELIAQHPCTPRDQSRLLLVERQTGHFTELTFKDLKDFLQGGDHLVFNDTKVIPARLLGKREQGGQAEIFLVKRLSLDSWEVLARPGKKLRLGAVVTFGEDFSCQIVEARADGIKVVRFRWLHTFEEALGQYGQIPLPHYIQREKQELIDLERYQTVYATHPGALAAPTAGLHFTEELLQDLTIKGVKKSHVTLHVGLGTFKPVQVEDIRAHPMHTESFIISAPVAQDLNARDSRHRQICVGTTCCRALESSANQEGKIIPGQYETNIFIYPGYQFRYVQSLLTNFHLPGSTLLMLVCAFAGYELVREAYAKAIEKRFRFYSYGDAMLII
jgi:S-adenosylmethionine:tRNA ribosyltransferase-isomerase